MRRLLAGTAALLLSVPTALRAQAPEITITPSGGQYNVNDQVGVTIEYCSPAGGGFFDGPPGVTWNGANAGFSWSPGYNPSCDDYGTATGTVTIEIAGQNVLATSITSVPGGYGSAQAIYDAGSPPPTPPPTVTPDGEPVHVPPGSGITHRFLVQNNLPYGDRTT